MKYCRNARNRYRNFLDDNKKVSEKSVEEKMKSTVKNEISREKDVQEQLKKTIERMRHEADELANRAEKDKKMSLLSESNSVRKRALEIRDNLEGSICRMQKLEEKYNKM